MLRVALPLKFLLHLPLLLLAPNIICSVIRLDTKWLFLITKNILLACLGRGCWDDGMYCTPRPHLSTNKTSECAETRRLVHPLPLQLHAYLTMTYQESLQGHCWDTTLQPGSEQISSDPELVASKRTFLCGSRQENHFKEGPGSFGCLSRWPRAFPLKDHVA